MPTFEEIYAEHADMYDHLVEREDVRGNLVQAIGEVRPLAGLEVVEFGAGTGRITRQLVPLVKHIRAYDYSAHMLEVARRHLEETGFTNWAVDVADNKAIPLPDASADMTVAGWTFGHQTEWKADAWQDEIGAAVDEMQRLLRDGGAAVIIETMGTGSRTPAPPNAQLAAYYAWLENERGFHYKWIRTDYHFESVDEGVELFRFFFGSALADKVAHDGSAVVSECTGVWWWEK